MAKHRAKISEGLRVRVYVRDNYTCQYCGLVFEPDTTWNGETGAPVLRGVEPLTFLELDHVHPLALGGDNSFDNLRAACTPCNKRKLATTRYAKWPGRIALALEVLQSRPPTEETARKAAAYLLGFKESELPKPKTLREAGF